MTNLPLIYSTAQWSKRKLKIKQAVTDHKILAKNCGSVYARSVSLANAGKNCLCKKEVNRLSIYSIDFRAT
jgi:hypothetical protein